MKTPRRGGVYLVSFDPTIGSEIKKTRPAVVVQNDIANRHSPVSIVAAVSSRFKVPPYPTDVVIDPREGGLKTRSAVLLNQIQSIDKRRLIKRLGSLKPSTMDRVDDALRIAVGLAGI